MNKNILTTGVDYLSSLVQNGNVIYDGPSDIWSGTDDECGGIVNHGTGGVVVSVSIFEQNSQTVDTSYTFNENGTVDVSVASVKTENEDNISLYASHNYDDNGSLVSSDVIMHNSNGSSEHHLFLYQDDGNGCLEMLGHAQSSASVIDINLENGKIIEHNGVGIDCKVDFTDGKLLDKEEIEALAEKGEIVLPNDWEDICADLPNYETEVNPDDEVNPDNCVDTIYDANDK